MELDGIRGLAIAMVLLWHYVHDSAHPVEGTIIYYAVALLRLFWSGVDLFFVMSGLLIGGILLDAKHCKGFFRTFYSRRFCRIVPLYALWLSILGIVAVLFAKPGQIFAPEVIPLWSYPLFIQNIWMAVHQSFGPAWLAPLWSLSGRRAVLPAPADRHLLFSTKTCAWISAGASLARLAFAPLLLPPGIQQRRMCFSRAVWMPWLSVFYSPCCCATVPP